MAWFCLADSAEVACSRSTSMRNSFLQSRRKVSYAVLCFIFQNRCICFESRRLQNFRAE
jgi:hypothetical protein